jgi:glucokinase
MTEARLLIGVDVGGTKTSVASMRDGAVGRPLVRPTERSSAEALLAQIVAQVREVAAGASPAAVGVGIPSVVEFATGRVRSSVNIPLQDVPLRTVLSDRLGLPVFVDNDATVAALAEAHDEQGHLDVRSLVMLTVGTGVGGGIVIDGRPYRGATGAAGELGHTLVALSELIPAATSFPQPGSLESLAAGHVLDRLAQEAATTHPESALGVTLAARGSVAGPDAIGGGVSSAGELLLEPARSAALEYVLPGVGTATEIRIARSGPQAGVRGAALLARSELNSQNGEAR